LFQIQNKNQAFIIFRRSLLSWPGVRGYVTVSSMQKIRVLIVDDNPAACVRLAAAIKSQKNFEIVCEAVSGQEALSKASTVNPDVVLVGVSSVLQTAWLSFCSRIARESRSLRAVLSVRGEDAEHLRSLVDTVVTLIEKPISNDRLTIISPRGEMPPPPITRPAHPEASGKKERTTPPLKKEGRLSERERQILLFLAEGYNNREIAARIFRSVKTVEAYRANIRRKLGLQNRAEIVQFVRAQGSQNNGFCGRGDCNRRIRAWR
jgi:DNA-binding NarL/FixJ family response regulator